MDDPRGVGSDGWSGDVFASIPGGIFRTSLDGKLIAANQSMARLLGYGSSVEALSSITSTPNQIWVDPAERTRHTERVLRDGLVRADPCHFKRKDGTTLWVALTTRRVTAPNGTALCFEGYFDDISDRHAAESALREVTRLNQQIIDSAQDGIAVCDRDLRYQMWNRFMQEVTGADATEVLGRRADEVFPVLRQHGVIAKLERILAGGPPERQEFRYTGQRTGVVRWVSDVSGPLRNEAGDIVGVISTVRDVTERKLTEAKVQASERRYRVLFDSAPIALCEADFSAVKVMLDELTAADGADVAHLLEPSAEEAARLLGLVTMLDTNRAAVALLGARDKDELLTRWAEAVPTDSMRATVETVLGAYARNTAVSRDLALRTLTGKTLTVHLEVTVVSGANDVDGERSPQSSWSRVLICIVDITARRQALEALRKSEEKFSTLFRASPAAMALSDRTDGDRALDVNRAFEKLTGYSRDEIVGKTFAELGIGADTTQHDDTVDLSTTQGRADGVECLFRRKDGQLRSGILFAEPIEVDGRPCIVSAVLDVTERRLAEEAATESESRFTEFMHNLPAAAFIKSATGETLFVNHYLEQFPGFADWRGRTTVDLVGGDTGARMSADDHRALAEGVIRVEEHLTDAQGVPRTFETVKFPLHIPGKPPLLAGVSLDITERKRAEEALEERERQYHSLFENMHSGFILLEVILDAAGKPVDHRLLQANPAFDAMTGLHHEQEIGRTGAELSFKWPPEVRERYYDIAMTGGVLYLERFNESLGRHYDVRAFSPGKGRWAMLFHDTTDQKRLQEELRQAQKMEAIGRLAGGVAHDFNNILASIMLNVGLAETEPGLPPHLKQTFSEVQTEATRAANLTRQLLQFSRRTVMDAKLIDAAEVVVNLLKMLGRLIGENISLTFERSGAPALVRADTGMLEQVLVNLAVNARDAMPRGGKLAIAIDEVTVDPGDTGPTERAGRFVRLTVTDSGSGMDDETRKHIFEPFFTTKEAGRGTGLGLATVYGIVTQHQGRVEVDSERDQGSTFRVYLPAATGEPVAASGAPRPPSTVSARGDRTVLLVEDATSLRQKLAQGLRLLGYRVLEAGDGKEALICWQEHRSEIDLLFTDMVMPAGLSGLDLVETFRAARPDLPVIVSSGYSAELAGLDNAAAPGVVYLKKPYDLETLARTIERCLDQS